MAEPLGVLEVKIKGDTTPLEKNLGDAKAMAEKTAAEIAAIEAKWLAREYRERVAYEGKKEEAAKRAASVAEREAARAAAAQEREAKRAAAAVEREAKRAALTREKEAARAAMAEARATSRGTLTGLGGGTSTRISDVGGRLPGGRGPGAQIAAESKQATFALMQLGNTLDDLQYVGTMGLRPILNNIMQFAPQVGIALLGFDMLRKGIVAAFNALTSGGTLSEFATDVEKLKVKVEELEGAWLKTARAVKTLGQARADLTASEEAQKVKDMPSEEQEGNRRSFEDAAKKAGGGGTESVLRGLLSKHFTAKDVEESVQSGRITHEEAYGHGIEGKSAKEINQLMEGDKVVEADLRELTLGKMVNEWMADLARGDKAARARLLAMIEADKKLGQREGPEGEGSYKNKFARELEEGPFRDADKDMEAEEEKTRKYRIEHAEKREKRAKADAAKLREINERFRKATEEVEEDQQRERMRTAEAVVSRAMQNRGRAGPEFTGLTDLSRQMNLSGTKDPAEQQLSAAELQKAAAELNMETARKQANVKAALAVAAP
jgi:hypothetical protein